MCHQSYKHHQCQNLYILNKIEITKDLHEVGIFPVFKEHVKLCIVIKVCHWLYWHFACHYICFNDVGIREKAYIPYRGIFCHKARRLEGPHYKTPIRIFLVVSINYRELYIIILKLISKSGVKSLWFYLKKTRIFNTYKEPNWWIFRLPSRRFLKDGLCFHLWNIESADLDPWLFRCLYLKVFSTAR